MAKGLIPVSEYAAGTDPAPALEESRRRWYAERLEEGNILFFERAPFPLPDAQDRTALASARQASAAYHKNISYRPGEDRVKGLAKAGGDEETVRRILRAYSQHATRLLAELFPWYASQWKLDFASFRPVEERGRQLSLRARNDLLHVDAFPTRPTNGSRILRAFTNVNPTTSRLWITTDTFEVLAPRLAMEAGLGAIAARARSRWRDASRGLARLARRLGIAEHGLPDELSQVPLGVPAGIHVDRAHRHGPARRGVRPVRAGADGHRPVPGSRPPRPGPALRPRAPVPCPADRLAPAEPATGVQASPAYRMKR